MKNLFLSLPVCLLLLTACPSDIPPFDKEQITGYRPQYESSVADSLQIMNARTIYDPNNVLVYNHLILIEEYEEGFHVIDNSEPSAPKNIAFVPVPMLTSMNIRDGVLYATSGMNLLAIEIDEELNLTHEIIHDVFPVYHAPIPPENNIYFECVDESKGDIIGWQKTTIYDPQCYY
ncbi:hypothetical protein [Reichenbachiella versicolor]|uniref:hypothetical protein n=1 Tax=Reichenbachiella versicolor TaxID=1821036 RepID=UPI0013A54AD9|nr:hypothetical protein [Reichenbachiella versicolor]